MKQFLIPLSCAVALSATALSAEPEDDDPGGVLNPDEMTWQSMLDRAEKGWTGIVLCSTGYMRTKAGDHATARALFENCANAGYTGAMTWMSQLDNNGLGGDYDPDASAAWDQQAAELGDRVGKGNHGINVRRGHGIAKDEGLGRREVEEAASEGREIAKRWQGAGYDLDEVTPEADNWKDAPLF